MFYWITIGIVLALAAAIFAFGGRTDADLHLGLYITIILVIFALGAVLLRRRSSQRRKP